MVSFLHAADLHLGMRITRFHADHAKKIREARFQALDNLLTLAREQDVAFLLIAGDLFDDHAVDNLTAQRAFEMLDGAALPVYVLPGNHDPLLPGAVWDRPPWNKAETRRVQLLRQPEPVAPCPGVVLLPCPLYRKTSLHDPTAWIDPAGATRTDVRIGVAHGSLKIRDNLPADDHLIAFDTAAVRRLDYLALGHWHRRQLFAGSDRVERTAYPGVHEPMRFPDNTDVRTGWVPYSGGNRAEFLDAGKGEVLLVRLERPGAVPEIRALEVGQLIWQDEQRSLASDDDLSRLIADIATRTQRERRLLRLQLSGVLAAAAMLRLDELRQVLEGRYFLGELDISALHVQPTPDEVREVAGAGVLRLILETLQHEAGSAEGDVKETAERAILLLYQVAKEVQSC